MMKISYPKGTIRSKKYNKKYCVFAQYAEEQSILFYHFLFIIIVHELSKLLYINSIPSQAEGKTGSYECTDPSLGVDEGPSHLFPVRCANGTYKVPEEDDHWPACLKRTTTISPG